MKDTKISWTDQTENPIRATNRATGKRGWHCVKVSEGCKNCYAERINRGPWGNGLPFREDVRQNVQLYLEEKVLVRLERQRAGKKVFLCDMTDMFQEAVPVKWIARIWATMALCQHHTFQVLTKRADRMQRVLSDPGFTDMVDSIMARRADENGWELRELEEYPLRNVWLMVSAENQAMADERIPCLQKTPAAVRGLSLEPLLGPITFRPQAASMQEVVQAYLLNKADRYSAPEMLSGIDWVIAGGESGPHFREMNPDWARSLRDQCRAAGVALWYKQGSALRSEQNTRLDGQELHQFPFGEAPTLQTEHDL